MSLYKRALMSSVSSSPPVPCNGDQLTILHGIPYLLFANGTSVPPILFGLVHLKDIRVRFWIHISLVIVGFLLAAVSFFVQLCKPIPYGKHLEGRPRCPVPVLISSVIAHLVPGFIFFTLAYFLEGIYFRNPINIVLYVLFVVHYVVKGLVMPILSRHSSSKISLWIPVATLLTNTFYHYLNAEFIGSVNYCNKYFYDPRFIVGALLFAIGFIIGRAADFQLIYLRLRESRKNKDYVVPKGFLFALVSSPNYFGEGLEWFGWALMTWSLSGLVWWLFVESTLITRARHNHNWYVVEFPNYPLHRKALIPFIY